MMSANAQIERVLRGLSRTGDLAPTDTRSDYGDLSDRIRKREARQRRYALVTGLIALLVPLAVVGSMRLRGSRAGAEAAGVLNVQCGPEGLEAGEAVIARSEGVPFSVDVAPSYTVAVQGHGGVDGDFLLALRPGQGYSITCSDFDFAQVGETQFAVVDPQGGWIAPFEGCSESWVGEDGPYAGSERDLDRFGRVAFGDIRRPGDVYRWTGYALSEQEAHVDLVREGTAIASAMFTNEGGGWMLSAGHGPCG